MAQTPTIVQPIPRTVIGKVAIRYSVEVLKKESWIRMYCSNKIDVANKWREYEITDEGAAECNVRIVDEWA